MCIDIRTLLTNCFVLVCTAVPPDCISPACQLVNMSVLRTAKIGNAWVMQGRIIVEALLDSSTRFRFRQHGVLEKPTLSIVAET